MSAYKKIECDFVDKDILLKIEDNKLFECNLEMHKTDIPDVFKLFGVFLDKGVYIKKRIGIAYIPTYILSLKCKNLYMGYSSKIIKCMFNSYKGQFIPIEESAVQKIDIINNDKRLKITEEEIVDNDNQVDEPN